MAKTNEELGSQLNIIANGTSIVGNIKADGDVRIDGILEGNITSKSKIVVGPTGKITGEIICKDIEIAGNINGKITVENLVSLKSTSIVKGEIKTTKLSIEPNSIFSGTCDMSTYENDTPTM